MLVRILSYQGREGFGEHFHAEFELASGGGPCDFRWAAAPRQGGKDSPLARIKDAGTLMQAFPDPLVPRVLAVTPCWNGLAVISQHPEGLRLAQIEERPMPEPVILEILRQVAGLLDRVYTRKDPDSGEMLRILHRNISTECVILRPDGELRVTGFDRMSTVWSARAAETSAMATHPGARLAPEQMAGQAFHTSDVYLLGLVAVDLLVNPDRASQFARMLAMCICDPEGFIELREKLLQDPSLACTDGLRGLLREMLQEDPKDRPTAGEVAQRAASAGADRRALAKFGAGLVVPPPPEGLFHQFVGRSLDLPDPEGLPEPEPQRSMTAVPPDDEEDHTEKDIPEPSAPAAPAEPAAQANPAAPAQPGPASVVADPSSAAPRPAAAPAPKPKPKPKPPRPPAVESVTPGTAGQPAKPKPKPKPKPNHRKAVTNAAPPPPQPHPAPPPDAKPPPAPPPAAPGAAAAAASAPPPAPAPQPKPKPKPKRKKPQIVSFEENAPQERHAAPAAESKPDYGGGDDDFDEWLAARKRKKRITMVLLALLVLLALAIGICGGGAWVLYNKFMGAGAEAEAALEEALEAAPAPEPPAEEEPVEEEDAAEEAAEGEEEPAP